MTAKTNITHQNTEAVSEAQVMPRSQMAQDLKTAVLIVSVVANLIVFTTWIALQITTQFDAQVASLLFTR